MVRMELTEEEARLLLQELKAREHWRELELVHTDAPRLQHEVRDDYDRLHALVEKIGRMVGGGEVPRT